ncbi:P-loop containing nucleoside triphosphate hydrolase protein [Cadophora sp. DSE1049]|nr:P-loop containing nucleoside triphosphate hydrolase protein [Cadophora sp. DSE1049]
MDQDDTPVQPLIPATNGTSAQADGSHGLSHIVPSKTQEDPNATKSGTGLAPTKPTKILRFNSKTGTIGSPPAKKIVPAAEPDKPKTKPARGRRPKTVILTIRYGEGQIFPSSLGQKIEQILSSPPKAQAPKQEQAVPTKPEPAKSNPSKPPKPVHPLFLGKAAQKNQTSQTPAANDNDIIDITGNQDTTAQSRVRPATQPKGPSPKKPSVPFSGFGSTSKLVKFPGAVEPAWPWKGMVHVRGADAMPETVGSAIASPPAMSNVKKSKYQATRISGTENIVESLAADLSIKSVVQSLQDINPDEYPTIPQCLRVPIKHYESGFDIQKRVRKLLRSRMPLPRAAPVSSSEDEVQVDEVHPALLRIYTSIVTSMSAFDKGQCETQAWVHKYSPKRSTEVLQKGREADVLKNWLQALTVQSIEIGSGGKANAATKSENAPKRKRKSKKLDDFVISTDEEDHDMDEITEPEDELPSSNPRQQRKTVVRGKDAAALGSKVANAIVLSGPHGCGKTAAVYAAAKELGFEVFEINAGGRRSGKDILERVGDMARNHQVQRSSAPTEADGSSEDRERIDNALADDLKSGRQGKMDSFFKSQPAKSKPKLKAKEAPNGIFSKMSTKKQQQALILIEEADILYKEDGQFWTTILNLIATSKRPIVITCNDESLIPMNDLKLHATIRMEPPPVDLAVDYLLLVAACEGHIIKRKAAKELYEGRNLDLRASLAELNFWCQFAVGDVKGGLGWYYPRWPAGNDIDEHGNVIRVVSEGTYEAGMGWLSQDYLESHIHYLDIEEETLHEACDGWELDLGDWVENIGIEKWANKLRDNSNGKRDNFAALNMYADFAESMSVADLCSGGTFAPENQISLDVSFPELSMKARDDYTLAFELKEAPTLVTYNTTGNDISLYMKSRTRKVLHLDQHLQHNLEVPTELDRPSEATILRLIRNITTSPREKLDRFDFSSAFDPIAASEKYVWSNSLESSSFDRTLTMIAEDLAPYVRSIVAYDARLQEDRLKLSSLMSEGGKRAGKRMRTTRAAMSALEGGARVSTRRDRYFKAELNSNWVLRTGMESWTDAALTEMETTEAPTSSRRSSKASLEDAEREESGRDELMDSSP